MTTATEGRPVYCYLGEQPIGNPHAIILEISAEDNAKWVAVREREDSRLSRFQCGTPVVVTNLTDDHEYVLRTAPCGEGCRCAAIATPLEQAGRLFVGMDCTLDGLDATIAGSQLEAGIVAHYPQGLRVEFAWPTIAKVMSEGGRFQS